MTFGARFCCCLRTECNTRLYHPTKGSSAERISNLCELLHRGFQDFQWWLQAFPNVVFSFNGSLLQRKKASYIINKGCSLHGLGEDLVRNQCIPLIATKIGIIHHMLTEAVLATTHHNTWHFFNLVWH